MLKLRQALDRDGMGDKQIGYTTRFNAFWNDETRPCGYTSFPSDGEGLTIEETLNGMGSSLNKIVNWVNVMMYDVPPADLAAPEGFTLNNYKEVFDSFGKYICKNKIVMGFEPGGQAAGGKWEGMQTDREVTHHIKDNDYGGVMFWAINQPTWKSREITGKNVQELARHAVGVFNNTIQASTSTTRASSSVATSNQRTPFRTTTATSNLIPSGPIAEIESAPGELLICHPAGDYASHPRMEKWCNINCNFIKPYCPSSHCICTTKDTVKKATKPEKTAGRVRLRNQSIPRRRLSQR